MSKKVTLTITVNDEKALNDLGIGIIAERDNKMVGYGDLTANELEKLSIVFNNLVLHKETNMNKKEIKRAKHILRRGTTKEIFNENDSNDISKIPESIMKESLNIFPPDVQRIAYISIGYAKMGKLVPYDLNDYFCCKLTETENNIIECLVKDTLMKAKNRINKRGSILINDEPEFDADGYFIWHNGCVVDHIGSQIEQDMFFHELIGRGINFIVKGDDVFFPFSFDWDNAQKILVCFHHQKSGKKNA